MKFLSCSYDNQVIDLTEVVDTSQNRPKDDSDDFYIVENIEGIPTESDRIKRGRPLAENTTNVEPDDEGIISIKSSYLQSHVTKRRKKDLKLENIESEPLWYKTLFRINHIYRR